MQHTITSSQLTVTVDEHGAELRSIVGRDGIRYLCPEEKRNWNGSAPVLFPNTGWVKDGYVLIGGERYPFVQHGFAKDADFVLEERQPDRLVFALRWSEESLKMYPFAFALRICYQVQDDTLWVKTQVENEGNVSMPFSIGFHPGFACPLKPEEQAQDYVFTFPGPMTAARLTLRDAMVDQRIERFWDGITQLPVQEGMFDGGSFTMTSLTQRSVRLHSKQSGRGVEVFLGDYPNLVLWAPKHCPITNICIEPWYGVPDALDRGHSLINKPDTLIVEPKQHKEVVFSARFY